MVDINKYLETQLALAAKQKSGPKLGNKFNNVSKTSKSLADNISSKQDKQLKPNKNGTKESKSIKPRTSAESENESDYLPSCDEEDDEKINTITLKITRSKHIKRIVDDGDLQLFNDRLHLWRENLTAAQSGSYQDGYFSADIQYILDGNKDNDTNHELQNGFCIPNSIWKQLYKYQRTGVKWLWELHQTASGGILGDEMGLGKTVQIIAFLTGLLNTDSGRWGGLGPSIIVAPATVIYQWVSHFHYWCPNLRVSVLHHSGSHVGKHHKLIKEIHSSHGIILITYAGIVRYAKDMMSFKWHYIILDEGHKIRNPDTQVSKTVKQFNTPHKLIITGSPMQNNLQELWSLFDFIRPGLLGTHNVFMEHFAHPITQGGYANATEFQEATALEIAKALRNMITPYMLRRTKAEVQEHIRLPDKNEQVLFCSLTQEQRDLYMGYLMSGTVRSILDKEMRHGSPFRARVLVALTTLRKICNHPDLYLYEAYEDQEEIDEQKFGYFKRSGKMTVVHSLLKIWQKQGHRTLIFSQSRAMLCLLEQYLQNHKFEYLKMDGTVGVGQRQTLIKTFNEDPKYLVFLSTTRVGGLGVNLTGADRVIIYDPDWNPATDNQAKERAWRIGQQKTVTVYRLLSAGTIEEKIYQRQIFKHFLSNKILIDPNQKNVLTTSTLQGLFTLEELNTEGDTETASLFKHTKVNMNKVKQLTPGNTDEESIIKSKLEAMRKKAREISKKISQNSAPSKESKAEDPREKYKQKRELLLNPPKDLDEPELNIVDDNVTNVPFDNVLSELDIINIHAKKNYEETLIKEVLKSKIDCKEGEISNESKTEQEEGEISNDSENDLRPENSISPINNEQNSCTASTSDNHNKQKESRSFEQNKKHRKRRHSKTEPSDLEIDNLVAVKKVKKKKHKKVKEKNDDDDYVLSKLFAKANVKNALQHDVVVGLAEKEKKHRMKEEASKRAREAIKAIKLSHYK